MSGLRPVVRCAPLVLVLVLKNPQCTVPSRSEGACSIAREPHATISYHCGCALRLNTGGTMVIHESRAPLRSSVVDRHGTAYHFTAPVVSPAGFPFHPHKTVNKVFEVI